MEPMILTLLPAYRGGSALVWEVPSPSAGARPPLRIRHLIETPDGPHVEVWERVEITSEGRADYRLTCIVGVGE